MSDKSQHKVVLVTSLGGFLEFYDFIIYALMAGYLADQFFPSHDPYSSLLITFATFSAGYLARPLGGLVFGHLGDCHGRKPTFAATVLMMALSTALIGCLPTYEQAGILAPILLTSLRVLQGFSIGGEIPGALTYLSETVEKNQGVVISLLFMGLINGFVFGSIVHWLMLCALGAETMADWGWRLPFLLGGSLGVCSYVVRKKFSESTLFLKFDAQQQRKKVPIGILLKEHKAALLAGISITVPYAVTIPLLFLFPQSYLTRFLDYSPEAVAMAGGIANFCASLVFVFVGWLADRQSTWSGKIRLMVFALVVEIVLAFPIFLAYSRHQISVHGVMMVSGLVLGLLTGIGPLLLSQLFPTPVRYSGIAFSYNVGLALFGGLTPLIAMSLIKTTGDLASPAVYLVISGLAGLFGCLLLRVLKPVETVPHQDTQTELKESG